MTYEKGLISRRGLIGGLATTSIGLGNAVSALDEQPLYARAAKRGLLFGSMAGREFVEKDSEFSAAILSECAMIGPGDEMKWGWIEPKRGVLNYSGADWVAGFARQNKLALRAQPAVWAQNVPYWLASALTSDAKTEIFENHIRELVTRYKGGARQWDVVNEAIEPTHAEPGGLRNSIFYRTFGPGYIANAFRIARSVDPTAKLFYNEYGIEYASPDEEARRRSTVNLLQGLIQQSVPIDGLGIQSHLKVGNRFDPNVFRRFLADIASLGLRIMITEFDVNDERLAAATETRDREVADHARRYLDVTFDEKAVVGMMAWGLSDRYTWLNAKGRARADGNRSRALPLDEHMRRKPLWYAIASSLDHAPSR